MRRVKLLCIGVFVLMSLSCKEERKVKNDIQIENKVKFDGLSEQMDTVKNIVPIIEKTCDSIDIKFKIDINPNNEILKSVYNKDLNTLIVQFGKKLPYSMDYNNLSELLTNWGVKNGNDSTFWSFLQGHLEMEGTYLNDSTYVVPALSILESVECNYEGKHVTLDNTNVYSSPNLNSEIISTIRKNQILAFDNVISLSQTENNKNYPYVETFDDNIWYYSNKFQGYINNVNVWDLYYSPVFYFEKTQGNRWLLNSISSFD